MRFHLRRLTRAAASAAVVATVAATIFVVGSSTAQAAPAGLVPRPADQVTTDLLPTAQIDGVAWTQVIAGDTVFVGGSFANARPSGTTTASNVARSNIMAYNLKTGALLPFAPVIDKQVRGLEVSPDGRTLYVTGDFTLVGAANRYRIAAFDIATGTLLTTFQPKLPTSGYDIVATTTAVYVGGNFTTANGVARTRLAAFAPSNGALLDWAPTANSVVRTMVKSSDGASIIAGGSFTTVNGTAAVGLASLSATTGALRSFAANSIIKNGGTAAAILSLSVQGDSVYGGGYKYGGSGLNTLEGVFKLDTATGEVKWINDCHGDTYGVYATTTAVYQVGHSHYCGNNMGRPQPATWNFNRATAYTPAATGTLIHDVMGSGYMNWRGYPSPSAINWFPKLAIGSYTESQQAAWDVTGNGQYVVLGGEFVSVNGVAQQGLARFAVSSIAPDADGPQLTGAQFVPTLSSPSNGAVRLDFLANWDRDDRDLTYRITRTGTTAPVYTTTVASAEWNRPALGYLDTGLTPGTAYTYRVSATDPSGNVALSDSRTITATSAGSPLTNYGNTVLAQGASLYWPFLETSGTNVADYAGFNDATLDTGATPGVAGAIGTADKAVTTSGAAGGDLASSGALTAPNTFTASTWFTTTSTSGGRILGFSDLQTGNSGHRDRMIYMSNTGRVSFAVFGETTQAANSITGTPSYNDGKWHQATATMGSGGMALYVDGVRVASRTDVTAGEKYVGYWRAGGDSYSGYSNVGTSAYFAGSIDEISVFPTVLTQAQITAQFAAASGTGTPANVRPTASFTSSTSTLTATVNGSASSDPDGTVASYAWDFGDGTTATGSTASRTYAAAGTYTVTLTVTDNGGAIGSTSKSVTVAPATNAAPTASFTTSTGGQTVAVDGTASADPDGTIASYAWDFGDGATANGATASHTYVTAASFTVTLKVTDNAGATGTSTKSVTVGAGAFFARDTFARTRASGWGDAEVGGTWTVNNGATASSVSNGSGKLPGVAGGLRSATLTAVQSADVDLRATIAIDKQSAGGSTLLSTVVRKTAGGEYRMTSYLTAAGTVSVYLVKVVAGTATTLKSQTITGLTYAANSTINVRFVVTGSTTVALSAKAWSSATEPAAFQVTATDTAPAAALQGAGSVSLTNYVSSAATNAPVTAAFGNVSVQAP